MKTFHDAWRQFYPDSQPLGHIISSAEREKWLRFHSLPDSKRYSENDEEMAVVLERQNTIAVDVLGSESPCWIVTSPYIPESEPHGDDKWLDNHHKLISDYKLSFSHRFSEPGDDIEYNCFAAMTTWQTGRFDNALRDIADDKLRALWMSADTGAIFAPYDGGVDLILPDVSEISSLRIKYSDWLSSHPRGY